MSKKFNFTLIEILVAAGIIAILAGIGFSSYSYANKSGRERTTKAVITQISVALDSCYNKLGFYPAASEYGDIKITFEDGIPKELAFGSETFKDSDTKTQKKFFDMFAKSVDLNGLRAYCGTDGILRDSWGNPIKFKYPGNVNKNKFDMISSGEDGKFGSDKTDAPGTAKSAYIDDAGDWICDDIANF